MKNWNTTCQAGNDNLSWYFILYSIIMLYVLLLLQTCFLSILWYQNKQSLHQSFHAFVYGPA